MSISDQYEPSSGYARIAKPEHVDQLITRISDRERSYPIVLISTPNKSLTPRIDIERVASGVRRKAPVFLIPTGDLTWKLTETGPVSVFGGAGCVIPLPPRIGKIRTLPLRFAYNPEDGDIAAEQLIDDVLGITGGEAAPRVEPVKDVAPIAPTVQIPVPVSRMSSTPTPTPRPHSLVSPQSYAVSMETQKHERELKAAQVALSEANARISSLRDELTRTRIEARETTKLELASMEAENVRLRRKITVHLAKPVPKRKLSTKGDDKDIDIIQADDFPTLDEAVRHSIYLAWVSRVPASEKASTPLVEYDLGSEFSQSLLTMTDQHQLKALKAAVDIITDTAKNIATRRIHILRTSPVSGAQPYTRAEDGAICYRANIETAVASARRLHYWKMPSGRVELIRVVTHDEVTP